MKIRKGFVSNSSSASFIVEVEMEEDDYGRYDHDKIFRSLYENMETFSTEGCKKLLEGRLEYEEKYNMPKEDAEDWKKKMYLSDIEDLKKRIKELEEYKDPDWMDYCSLDDEDEATNK